MMDVDKKAEVSRRSFRRSALRLVIIALATYAVVAILLLVFQRHLIYFPTRDYEGDPSEINLAYEDVTFRTADGVTLTGWFVPLGGADATVLFFHGNAGNISHRLHTIDLLHRLGFAVFIIDYRGYGKSEGKPSEQGLYRDADAAWEYLTATRGVRPESIVLMGRSLGGAVAIDLAARKSPGVLVVESTFSTMAELAKLHYPYFPIKLLLREKYDSIGQIGSVRCPVLILHGTGDELVPIDLGRSLFAAAPEPKEFIETPGGHNEAGFTHNYDFARKMKAFVDRFLK